MRLKRFVTPRLILLDIDVGSRDELLRTIASHVTEERPDIDAESLVQALVDRESLGGTAVGHGVALPHARVADEMEALVGLARLAHPIDFDAPDGEPVWLAAFSAVSASDSHRHMQILARLARVLDSPANRDSLKGAESPEDVMAILLGDDPAQG